MQLARPYVQDQSAAALLGVFIIYLLFLNLNFHQFDGQAYFFLAGCSVCRLSEFHQQVKPKILGYESLT